jgi:type II secretory pathway component GspD/PulD (secretin)
MKSFAEPRVCRTTLVGALIVFMGLAPCGQWAAAQNQPPMTEEDRGQAALAAGREALAAGRWREAVDRFTEALSYLPGNQEAIEGRENALRMLNQASTSEDVVRERNLQRQRAIAEFQESVRIAEERRRQGDYAGASQEITLALARLDERRDFLSEAEYQQRRREGTDLAATIERERVAADLAIQQRTREEADIARREQERLARQQRQRQIEENLRRVRQLQMELKYREALQVIDEVLFMDPINPAALALRDALQTTMMYRDYRDILREKELGIGATRVDAQRSMIPPRPNMTGPGAKSLSGLLEYPEDWPQVSHRRGGESGFQEPPANRAVWQKLQETSFPVDFNNNTFEQVKTFIEQVTGLSLYVDWKALNNVGIDRDTEVTLKLQNVNAATALQRILEQLGEGDQRPAYDVQEGILTVTSDEAMRKRTIILVYDIRDLLFQVPMFDNGPALDLNNALNQGQNQQGGGGGGGGGAGGGGGGGGGNQGNIFGNSQPEAPRLTRAELVRQIVDIIQENIDPDGWRDLGGTTGSLQELNGNLIITNTPNNHRQIEGLLAMLREIRALQINVESRFLTVATNWFEKIGVDLDLYFNTNDDVFQAARNVDPNFHLSDFFDGTGRLKDPVIFGSPAQVLNPAVPHNTFPSGAYFAIPGTAPPDNFQNTGYVPGAIGTSPIRTTSGFAPIGVTQNSAGLINSLANFVSPFAQGASAVPALTVGIQFLDDIQVDLLIEATQADRRSVVLTAPRLTFFNGQRSWVAVTTQTAFVSSLTPVTGDGSGAFAPDIGIVSDGFVLDVEGVISSDRRYVTMTVIFDFAELLALETQEFTGAAGGGGLGGGGAATFEGSISLPTVRVSQIRTTVSVPDKGTVLLGGQRRVEEIEVEVGVPVLSKIPFINRFFTNRATEKNEQTLLILIRPEIIIQQENEDLLFPGLSDSLGSGSSYLR